MRILKIVSGGQTGADRGGLDAAIEMSVPHGGWCPKGRKAEDEIIPAQYQLQETRTSDYLARTEANVVDSDATVVFTFGPATGGSLRTLEFAEKHGKPWLHVDLRRSSGEIAARRILMWLTEGVFGQPKPPATGVLNVAGSRESKSLGIAEQTKTVVALVLQQLKT